MERLIWCMLEIIKSFPFDLICSKNINRIKDLRTSFIYIHMLIAQCNRKLNQEKKPHFSTPKYSKIFGEMVCE